MARIPLLCRIPRIWSPRPLSLCSLGTIREQSRATGKWTLNCLAGVDPDSENGQYVVAAVYLPANAVDLRRLPEYSHIPSGGKLGAHRSGTDRGAEAGSKRVVAEHVSRREFLLRASSRYGWLFMSTAARSTLSKTGLRLSLEIQLLP